jgi:hypothetical protein
MESGVAHAEVLYLRPEYNKVPCMEYCEMQAIDVLIDKVDVSAKAAQRAAA